MKRFAMKRWMSTGFITTYVVALPLMALVVLLSFAVFKADTITDVGFGLPKWMPLATSLVVTVLVALRLWMHVRARKAVSAATPPETESKDD